MVHGCNVQDGYILHSVIYELDSRVGKIVIIQILDGHKSQNGLYQDIKLNFNLAVSFEFFLKSSHQIIAIFNLGNPAMIIFIQSVFYSFISAREMCSIKTNANRVTRLTYATHANCMYVLRPYRLQRTILISYRVRKLNLSIYHYLCSRGGKFSLRTLYIPRQSNLYLLLTNYII